MSHPALEGLGASADRRNLLKLGAGAAVGAGVIALGTATPAAASISNGSYYSVTPQRVIDTRKSGGRLSAGHTRTSAVLAGNQYVAVCNLTAIDTSGSGGYLEIYSADLTTRPTPYSSVSWQGAGKIVANLAIFDLGNAGLKIYCGGKGSTHYLLDFVGYYVAQPQTRTAKQKAFEGRAAEAARRLNAG